MNFRERKITYEELKGVKYLEADRALLEKLDPTNLLLQKKVFKPESQALEILWELLGRDDVTREMVVANRRELNKSDEKASAADLVIFGIIAEHCGTLTAKLQNSKTKDEAKILYDEIEIEASKLPVDVKILIINTAKSMYPDFKAKVKEDATIALLAAELILTDYKKLKELVIDLELTPADFKKVTLIAALDEYRLNLPKEDTGDVEVKEEVPVDGDASTASTSSANGASTESHSDQVIDQMNADIEDIKAQLLDVDLTVEKKEELEQRLNYLESDLEDLQDQHNDLQDQVNGLADDIEAEKKSQGV